MPHARLINLLNQRFGKLLVLKFVPKYFNDRGGWLCKCDCGAEKVLRPTLLLKGETFSCGCHRRNPGPRKAKEFGGIKAPEYRNWVNMKERCFRPEHISYPNYGGIGIAVCEEWKNSFENFMKDMGKKPTKQHSLDRIDNSKGYSPENCRWATAKEQANNRRSNSKVEFNGEVKNLKQWATLLGTNTTELRRFLNKGFSFEDIKKSLNKEESLCS